MTNYERICADKAFLAWLLNGDEQEFNEWMKWLDTEQRGVSDERAQDAGKGEAE
jgi:hypothetical protein